MAYHFRSITVNGKIYEVKSLDIIQSFTEMVLLDIVDMRGLEI